MPSGIFEKMSSHSYFPLAVASAEIFGFQLLAGRAVTGKFNFQPSDQVMQQFTDSLKSECLWRGLKNVPTAFAILIANRIFKVCVPFSKLALATVLVTMGGTLIGLINQYKNWYDGIHIINENLNTLKEDSTRALREAESKSVEKHELSNYCVELRQTINQLRKELNAYVKYFSNYGIEDLRNKEHGTIQNINKNHTEILEIINQIEQFFQSRAMEYLDFSYQFQSLIQESEKLIGILPEKLKRFQMSIADYFSEHLKDKISSFKQLSAEKGFVPKEVPRNDNGYIAAFIKFARNEVDEGNNDWNDLLSQAEWLKDALLDLTYIKQNREAHLQKTHGVYTTMQKKLQDLVNYIQTVFSIDLSLAPEVVQVKFANFNPQCKPVLQVIQQSYRAFVAAQQDISYFASATSSTSTS